MLHDDVVERDCISIRLRVNTVGLDECPDKYAASGELTLKGITMSSCTLTCTDKKKRPNPGSYTVGTGLATGMISAAQPERNFVHTS